MKISHKKVVEEHNQFAEEYDSWYEGSYNEYVREIEADILLMYLPKNKDIKILDAAGGTGSLAIPLAEQGYQVYCIDLAEKMLSLGKVKAKKKKADKNIIFKRVDITNMKEFKDNCFDFTFCFGTALSYCDPEKALKEFKRVTKKNCFIIVDFKSLYRNLGMLIVKKDEKRISKLLKTGLYSSDFHKYTEINYRIGDIENLVKKFKFKLGYILGKDIFYQYFSKLKSEDVDKIFNNQKNKKYFMDLDRQLRQNRNFIPLAIEIIAVLKK